MLTEDAEVDGKQFLKEASLWKPSLPKINSDMINEDDLTKEEEMAAVSFPFTYFPPDQGNARLQALRAEKGFRDTVEQAGNNR